MNNKIDILFDPRFNLNKVENGILVKININIVPNDDESTVAGKILILFYFHGK